MVRSCKHLYLFCLCSRDTAIEACIAKRDNSKTTWEFNVLMVGVLCQPVGSPVAIPCQATSFKQPVSILMNLNKAEIPTTATA